MSSAPTALQDRPVVTPMSLLAHGVPLSLLLDLALGPQSEDLFRREVSVPSPRPEPAA